jgi:hypothetical protein
MAEQNNKIALRKKFTCEIKPMKIKHIFPFGFIPFDLEKILQMKLNR